MGQYWVIVNLDKREFLHPHKLGSGVKLWEILADEMASKALVILLAAEREERGGGDLCLETGNPKYDAVARRIIGRWAGNRVALVGDYAEPGDLRYEDEADYIWSLCCGTPQQLAKLRVRAKRNARRAEAQGGLVEGRTAEEWWAEAHKLRDERRFEDITEDVKRVLEYELEAIGHWECG